MNEKGCGTCYGAEDEEHKCCNTCQEVQAAYHRMGWDFSNPNQIQQVNYSKLIKNKIYLF
ncbi:hypothetical protein M1146_04420 [Patescibacteria group bacterium]|nr:hypothetical protein [Patescibacteria group bacterium]